MSDWILATEQAGYTRHFDTAALPVAIGGDPADDIVLGEVSGSIQIGCLDDVFFVQPARGSENVRLDGELLQGSRRLTDGSVIALDTARLRCSLRDGRLHLAIEAQITAGDTAPPDFDALTRDRSEVTVSPIAFDPKAGKRQRERRFSKTSLVVYAAFVLLAVLGWFAFTAKSVRIETMPAAASLDLPETLFKFRLDERYLLRPGEHRIVAELDGYYPIDEVVRIGESASQRVELDFVRLPGLISFGTEPATAAEVRVDGELIGTTPIEDYELRPGSHQVEFRAERFLTEHVPIEVEGGHVRDAVTIELTPSWAPVTVSSVPAGAEIRVDGRPMGQTPAELELTAGERELEIARAGYNPWRGTIRVVADEPQVLPEVVLSLADGRLSLSSTPSEANITLNGSYAERTPRELSLEPNVEHRVTVTKPGYRSEAVTLTLAPGEREAIDFDLVEELGTVEITSAPEGARVFINGEAAGVTPLSVDLMTVEQEVTVSLDGFAEETQRITPRPGYTQELPFGLIPLDEATGSGYERVVTTGLGQNLLRISGGTIRMGAPRSDPDALVREKDRYRLVEVSQAFYLAEHEMTNGEYREACDPDHDSGAFEGISLNGDDQPVVNVRVQDIMACLNRLSIADGLQPVYSENAGMLSRTPGRNGYRLPTEAEFALALRVAGRGNAEPLRFPWGDSEVPPTDRLANIADLSASDILETTLVTYTDGYAVTAPVGSFPPNAAGLHDMGGNAAEWVQDFYDPLASFGEEVIVDPVGPETGRANIVRGPSWRSATTRQLRLSYIEYENEAREDIGFRIARDLD